MIQKERSIIKHLPRHSHDTKPLSSSSGNSEDIKSHIHYDNDKSLDSFRIVPSRVNVVDWGWIVGDLETITDLVLLAFNFIPQRHVLTLLRSRFMYSSTLLYHQAMAQQQPKCGVVTINVKPFLQCGERVRGVQEKQLHAQNTFMMHTWYHIKQFAPTTVHHNTLTD